MGQGAPSRIFYTPSSQATLAELIYRLGGEDHYIARAVPQVIAKNDGFAAHLDMAAILLRADMTGRIQNFDIVEYHFKRQPRNSFYSFLYHRYTDGNMDNAIRGLLDESLFPADRLPTSADRKAAWLWQRDDGPDWQPRAGVPHTHSGADFLFLAALILEKY